MVKTLLLLFSLLSISVVHGQRTISIAVSAPEDDLEEYIPGPGQTQTIGAMDAGSSDLELGSEDADNVDPQLVGVRFVNLDIPQGSLITSARIVFTVDATGKNTDPSNLVIHAQDDVAPLAFDVNIPFNISSRPVLEDSVEWSITTGSWATVGEAGRDQTTPDLTRLVQQLVSRADWNENSSLVFTFKGEGTREAESYDGSPDNAARLIITLVEPVTVAIRVSAPEDDLEEYIDGPTQTNTVGSMDAGSSDLELGTESGSGDDPQLVGIRFQNVDIPRGSIISKANIQFTVDETKSADAASYDILAQQEINPEPFDVNIPFNISSRPIFPNVVKWDVAADTWLNTGEAGPDQLSPDITELMQAIVDQDGWEAGQPCVFTISGTGTRVAESYDGSPTQAPLLVVQYFKLAELRQRVSAPEDDLEEYIDGPTQTNTIGSMDAGSSDLELGTESGSGDDPQLVGIRFRNIDLAPATPIREAYIQFTVDELKNAGEADFVIRAQAEPNPASFDVNIPFNISSRPVFEDSILWHVNADTWLNAGEAGSDELSPDISVLIERIINQDGWEAGNAIVFTIKGSGTKVAESYDGSPTQAPELIVRYLTSKRGLDISSFPLAQGSPWSYWDEADAPGDDWMTPEFDASGWPFANATFGYGDDAINTEISNQSAVAYFRKQIEITDYAALTDRQAIHLKADDGAVVYINGVMAVDFNSNGAEVVESYRERAYFMYEISKSLLQEGINTIAVKVNTSDADLLFDLALADLTAANNDTDYNCDTEPTNDDHIGCYASIIPTSQDDYLRVPSTHEFQYIVRKDDPYTDGSGSHGDDFDFTGYVPIDGSSRHGYLSINYEDSPGGVGILEIQFNAQSGLWEKLHSTGVDFSALGGTQDNCSGAVTPWATVITCEEDAGGATDSNGDGYYDYGWCTEIDPATATIRDHGTGSPQKLWALGRMDHENVVVKSDMRTVYYAEDAGNGSVYKFVADNPADLSSGEVFALQLDQPLMDFEPTGSTGKWIKIPNSTPQERNEVKAAAVALGATPFAGNEDVDLSPLNGKIYFSVKGAGRVYRFKDNGTTISEFETFVGGTSYVIQTEYGKVLEEWGQGNDNLTFDDRGNLYVLQDGTRNHIWMVGKDHTQEAPQVHVFFATPSGAEPTGMTFTPDYRYMFMSVQSPNGTQPQADVTGNAVVHDKDVALVIARSQFLNETQTGIFDGLHPGKESLTWTVSPNPFEDHITVSTEFPVGEQVQVILSNASGARIQDWQITTQRNEEFTTELPISNLPAGAYLLSLLTENRVATKLLLKL